MAAVMLSSVVWLMLVARILRASERKTVIWVVLPLLIVQCLLLMNTIAITGVQHLMLPVWLLFAGCSVAAYVRLKSPGKAKTAAADLKADALQGSLKSRNDESLRGFAELGAQWFWEMDQDLTITFVSDRLEAATGIAPEHVLGLTARQIRSSYFGNNRTFDAGLNTLESYKPFHEHDFIWNRNGVERTLSISGRPRFDVHGTFKGYFGIGRDVTEERRALALARDTEEKLKLLVDSLPVGIAYLGNDLHFQHSNGAYNSWFATTLDTPLNEHIRVVKGDELFEESLPAIECAMQGETVEFEEILLGSQSEPRHVQTTIVPHCRPEGDVQGLFILSLDISNQKRQVDRLARSLKYLGSAMNGLDSALVVLDTEARICTSNTAWKRFIDMNQSNAHTPVEQYGDIAELQRDQAGGNFASTIDDVVSFARGEREAVSAEIKIDHAGNERCFAITSSMFLNEGQRYVLISHEDVTARLRMTRELNERNMALAQTARLSSVGELAATIAHELNQPLTALSNYGAMVLDMMESPVKSEAAIKTSLEKMLRESRRAGGIVHRINNFVRQQPLDKVPVSVHVVVTEVLDSLADLAAETDTVLKISSASQQTTVKMDKSQLEQVIYNLVCNAIEAQSGQTDVALVDVSISAAPNGKDLEIRITDNGQGLSQDIGQSVFDPFKSSKRSGLGLGLAICRSIVEDHGGRIWHQRDSQQRCQFCFALPLHKDSQAA